MAGSASIPAPAGVEQAPRAPFPSILCGVDGSRAAFAAVEQAAVLAEPGGVVHLLAVVDAAGGGLAATATLGHARAEAALVRARRRVGHRAISVETELALGAANDRLLPAAEQYDLLVVGAHGTSRAAGIALGHTASVAVHRAEVPVLLARRPPSRVRFPATIVAASDGSHGGALAIDTAHRIALVQSGRVHVAHVCMHGDDRRMLVAEQAARLAGPETTCHYLEDEPVDGLVALAAELQASLVVVGSRGLTGLAALGSVSERVAHRAPCSVLVVRPARSG